ncbi:hypothetical protein K3495_g10603 [Podosphaera aphanis]|nr:hypothetical protein K3495_g10603 [Podosphaera aphanis]
MSLPWLDEWESVFEEDKYSKLIVAESPQAQYDFLFVARAIDKAWTTANLVGLGLDLEYDGIISDFPGYLKEFRQHQRLNEIFSRNTEDYSNSTSLSGVFTASIEIGSHNQQSDPSTIHMGRSRMGTRYTCVEKSIFTKGAFILSSKTPNVHQILLTEKKYSILSIKS